RTHMTWRTRDGRSLEEIPATGALQGLPSPDGRLIMFTVPDYQLNTVGYAIFDRANGTTAPFTAIDSTSTSPVWAPDSRRVVYSLVRNGAFDLYVKDVKSGAAEQRLLLHTDGIKAASSWSPDGNVILFTAIADRTRMDIWAIEARPGATPRPLVT